jgi:uncharacterized protein YndB with AHSA1/START domain
MSAAESVANSRQLSLKRRIEAPPSAVWRAWTEPALLKRWFAPAPWTTPHAELDVRAGGASLITMRGPDGAEFPNRGVYLEVVPERRLVFTDAFVRAWEPAEHPFMTVTITLEPDGACTLYSANVSHWTVADRERHEQMGFHEGWGKCADQLAVVAQSL